MVTIVFNISFIISIINSIFIIGLLIRNYQMGRDMSGMSDISRIVTRLNRVISDVLHIHEARISKIEQINGIQKSESIKDETKDGWQ